MFDIGALFEIERKAEAAMAATGRDRAKLPQRIAAEVGHIRQRYALEADRALKAMAEVHEKSTAASITAIQEESAMRLVDLEFDFAKYRPAMRQSLFDACLHESI